MLGKEHERDPPAEAEREAGEQRVEGVDEDGQGSNSIDIMNFGHETGHETGQSSGPHSVLGHYKFRYVSKLQKLLGQGSGPDTGPYKIPIELHPRKMAAKRPAAKAVQNTAVTYVPAASVVPRWDLTSSG